ncbi:Gfo/Idh/MocA family protein [Pseudoalteromonas luteoviolacea]|uniref:Alpha-N-acetylgalactosaminidase n=1 Tax=Pseudoalteromonas luteoviolacea S4054 TaxID=1129367 RepID=A0A0F6A801_9GAMM|nr:Gfo/Idh/MocA family oxidoreductase [Pseudoalteromonas luteoviolacea]AOT07124.1 alpha-N-acetylgalactosaminidase [Pseudoalteromonas luteoviolacea]AOT12041.1 alpha-N-acetylgalactosaminidase [Pseudoalteromonas luteoviolacea]AOT16954.1 alpha-N-acetylgalactosaminidase [Pseudoalteromonas luteoviolacea]KKE81529.1 alpha-N-acetylgalactosaminidase [Pseudoalteromonas luteoviolacea S4054]KZN70029.1 alpha-N-acetylgalactosaminidase [Pseudoalteromonas luteoviolacea S4047-1]
MTHINRRHFLKAAGVAAAAGVVAGCAQTNGQSTIATGSKGKSVIGLIAPKMEIVRVAFIGVGQRGYGHVKRMSHIDGAEIVAICDTHEEVLERSATFLTEKGLKKPALYSTGELAYKDMLTREDIDIVIISTPWKWHAQMAIDTMESGKHAFVEVPLALTVEEMWQIVDTAERTQKNCMMMENVNYGRDELMVLNMVRQGIFGDLLHGEAAYIHELRWQMKELEHKTGSWRTEWHTRRDGNLYPTHGLGPVSQYMNINRGDRFDYLTSMSSPALGRAAYAQREFPKEHQRNQWDYICGDMNTTMIKTVKGRSIIVQHDTTTPRPYSRHNLIQGTNGVFAGFPNRVALEQGGRGSFHDWDEDMDYWYGKYDHPLWVKMGKEAERNGGHGGMDFLMFWRMIYCLRNGEPLDQDVYDGAAWSVISPLSAQSVANRSESVSIPDFTRGHWKTATPLGIVGA